MTDPDPLPAGTPSALEAAAQNPPPRPRHHVMAAGTGAYEYTGSPSVLLLTLASQHLLAHARTLAVRTEGENHQMAVVFAHAACELHTEWAINQLLDARPDNHPTHLLVETEDGRRESVWIDKEGKPYPPGTIDPVEGRRK